MALVVKAAVHGDGGNGLVALTQGGASLLNAVAIEVLDGGEVETLFEVSLEGAEGETADFGHVDQFDFIGVLGGNVFDCAAKGGVM